jgi:hypothetical protein
MDEKCASFLSILKHINFFLGVPFSKAIILILARELIFNISGKKLWAIYRI